MRKVPPTDPEVRNNLLYCAYLGGVLASLGTTLFRASSGPEALERLREADFAAILLDVLDAKGDDYRESLGKGKLPLGKRPRRGWGCRSGRGNPVDFRNLEIRELWSGPLGRRRGQRYPNNEHCPVSQP